MKRVSALWWTVMVAFALGETIVLVTLGVCQTLYVSDPLMICLLVGGIAFAIALVSSGFTTVSENRTTYAEYAEYAQNGDAKDTTASVVKPIFRNAAKRLPLDTDPEDIDKVDELLRKEDAHVQAEAPKRGRHEAKTAKA